MKVRKLSSDGKSPSLPGIAAQKSVGQSTVLCRGTHLEHIIPCYTLVVEYGNACTVNETYTSASAKAKKLEEQHHLNRDSELEFNKAVNMRAALGTSRAGVP